ncbi:T-cell surface glycoprotein CD5 [Pteronotus mesoamericanus]|uniref:T-cell surface glycoprotein CD5 n=1 Tax=Pteronotus mesoamericanus TaxID=1884717 RepID=UPI0023EDFD9F|nr:T-cell surface glycoprotein CD5 [Pteronotus parnellii mesoamericanus]
MEPQQPLLAALCLLGVLVTSCLGGPNLLDSDLQVRLQGSNSQCQGQLEVQFDGKWHTVDSRSWGLSPERWEDPKEASKLCRRLNCGDALVLAHISYFNSPQNHVTCQGQLGSFFNCNVSVPNQRAPLGLICSEPPKTSPPTTRPPPTSPEPTAPPRLQLVPGPKGLQCAGVVEFYRGSLSGTISYEGQDGTKDLGNLICGALQCGSFLKHLPEAEAAETQAPGGIRPLPIQWKIQNTSCTSLEQCFRKVQPQEEGQALALICSGFQPKVQSRLVGGSGMCAGFVEVRQGRRWAALCHSLPDRGSSRWEEVCQEQQCGGVHSYQVVGAGEKTSRGAFCLSEKLSQCHQLQETAHCKRVFVTCKDPNPAGLGAGAVASIILALVLLAVLLVMCGPLAYKKLVKKFRQKKQRQWIGPTGMSQNMSFHRDHAMTVRRSQVENPAASHVENEYSQPPRNSQVSAYPALEGALHRVSTQPDNSSDSDYDLHGAQRL